jgi:DNA-binding CsgD family transcriptional regulator
MRDSLEPADPVVACLRGILATLEALVAFDQAEAIAFDPGSLLPVRVTAAPSADPGSVLLACFSEQKEDDLARYEALAKGSPSSSLLSIDQDPSCRSSHRWRLFNGPNGYRHELRSVLVDGRGLCWGAVALYRRGQLPFTARHLEALARITRSRVLDLARAMGSTWSAARLAEASWLLMSETGQVIDAPAQARRWLTEARGFDAIDQGAALLAALAGRVARVSRVDTFDDPSVRVVVPPLQCGWTTVIADPTPDVGQRGSGIPVILTPSSADHVLPIVASAFSLTPRETDLVSRLLYGADSRTMAAAMCMSTNTLQDHLKSIFDKTNSRSRRQLVALFTGRAAPPETASDRVPVGQA